MSIFPEDVCPECVPMCDTCDKPATEVHGGTDWFCADHFEQFRADLLGKEDQQ
jgi:hypothetical protein